MLHVALYPGETVFHRSLNTSAMRRNDKADAEVPVGRALISAHTVKQFKLR